LLLAAVGGLVGGAVLSSASGFTARAVLGRTASLGTMVIVTIAPPPIGATIVPAIAIGRIVAPPASLAAGQGCRDLGLDLSGPDNLEPFRFVPGHPGREDRGDPDPVDVLFGFYPEVVPGGGSVGEEGCLYRPARFPGSNGPPGPTAVLTTAGEFNVHTGHG